MPVLHLPTVLSQAIALGLVLTGFATFAITLLTVSVSVGRAQRAAQQPAPRSITPARRAETAA
jgi:hypothetical protein